MSARLLFFCACLLVAKPLAAQQRVDIRRTVTSNVSVRIYGSFAQLRIVGWKYDSLELTGTIPKGARLDGGVGGPTTPAPGAKFWIEPSPSDPSGGTLELRVPENARVWAKTTHATITADGVTGGLDLNIVAGSIVMNGNPREATLESMDGTVTVAGSPNWLRIKTGDGDVAVRGSVSDIAVTTVSGRVTITDGRIERARLESVTGPLVFGASLDRSASLTMDTHSGAIEFAIPARSNVFVDARTLTGRIDNSVSSKRPSPGRDNRGEELTLDLGTGGAQATLRSFKGSIKLSAR